MTRDEALALVREYVKNEGLIRHMLCVEACLRFYAEKFNEDVEAWGLLGLLHDFDWELHPTLDEHPVKGAPILRQRGVPEDIIQDILSHGVDTGVPRDTPRRKALYACDEITGLVTAVALVRPPAPFWTSSLPPSRRNGRTRPSPPAPTAARWKRRQRISASSFGSTSATLSPPCAASPPNSVWLEIFSNSYQ